MTLMTVIIVAIGGVLVLYPFVQQYQLQQQDKALVERFGNPDKSMREQAEREAIAIVRVTPRTERYLNSRLDDCDDRTFRAIVSGAHEGEESRPHFAQLPLSQSLPVNRRAAGKRRFDAASALVLPAGDAAGRRDGPLRRPGAGGRDQG